VGTYNFGDRRMKIRDDYTRSRVVPVRFGRKKSPGHGFTAGRSVFVCFVDKRRFYFFFPLVNNNNNKVDKRSRVLRRTTAVHKSTSSVYCTPGLKKRSHCPAPGPRRVAKIDSVLSLFLTFLPNVFLHTSCDICIYVLRYVRVSWYQTIYVLLGPTRIYIYIMVYLRCYDRGKEVVVVKLFFFSKTRLRQK